MNLGRNISSINNDVNIFRGKACTAIDSLLILTKSEISDKNKTVV